jgi:polysaccharide export outer membrane protein
MSHKNASTNTVVSSCLSGLCSLRAMHIYSLLCLGLALQASLATAQTAPALAEPATATNELADAHPLRIGKGDVVSVTVFDTPSLSFKDRVDEAGFLRAPVLGPIQIAGLNTQQASRLFEEKLRTSEIMLKPNVTVQDTEYATQGVVLLGQVKSPGTYNLPGPHSLYDALSAAGGVTDTAGPRITITHRGDPEQLDVIDVSSPNYSAIQRSTRIFPGDTIFVSKAEVFYVIGDVGHPGSFYIQNGKPLSVLNAIALASGDNDTAKYSAASIKRKTSAGVISIPFNLKNIKKGKENDIAVLPEDIIILPRSELKVALTTILPGAANSAIGTGVTAAVIR